jgi:hypothetical protein
MIKRKELASGRIWKSPTPKKSPAANEFVNEIVRALSLNFFLLFEKKGY